MEETEVRHDESLEAPQIEVVDEGGEVAEIIEMAEGVGEATKLEPLRRLEDGTLSRDIPHISVIKSRNKELREKEREKAERRKKPAESVEEQMERAREDMEDAFMSNPPLSRPQKRAARKEAQLKGVGYTKKRRKHAG